ncbi:MAG: D-2-hydroxyacid dehydrogenase [Chloroflexota bacterium]
MKILVAHIAPEDFEEALRSRFPNDDFHFTHVPDQLATDLETFQPEAVFTIKQKNFPPPFHPQITKCPSVRWIQVGGSGFEHIGSWDEARIQVTNCAGVLARFLAETVTGAMITLNNNSFLFRDQQRQKLWQTTTFTPLVGKTLLIVGVGHIGGWLAHNAKALGMNVIGVRHSGAPKDHVDEMVTPDQLEQVIGQADVVSIHLRHTAETENLFDAEMLSKMKTDSMLINTSRGAIVDQNALIEALTSGPIKNAYLDVFDPEPLPADSPLWNMDNVLITPHASDHVSDWPAIFGDFFADNLQRFKDGNILKNLV